MRKFYKSIPMSICFFLLTVSQPLLATCFIDNTLTPQTSLFPSTGSLTSTITTQGFTACETGQINSITVETSGGNIDLYLTIGDANTLNGTAIYQSFSNQIAGIVTLNLAIPFDVTIGDLITFGIKGPSQVRLDNNPPMTPVGGANEILSFINVGVVTTQSSMDLFFKADLTSNTSPLSTPIPTMNQWGLLIFCLLMLNLGIWGIHLKEQLQRGH